MSVEEQKRRLRLISLVHGDFHADNQLVAAAIAQRTGQNISVRAIQSWLMEPSRVSSRNCPDWAIKALEDYLQDPANAETIQLHKRLKTAAPISKSPLASSNELGSNTAVAIATGQIEHESENLAKWQEEFSPKQAAMISSLQIQLERSNALNASLLVKLGHALKCNENFEDFRKCFLEEEDALSLNHYYVTEAKRAIETHSEEFGDA